MRRAPYAVCIAGTGSFLPNEPVSNDRIDDVLGRLDDAPPRVQSFISNVGPRMRAGSGIEYRHFAVDPETKQLTHTIADMGLEASRQALDAANKRPDDVELLLISSPSYDQTTPPTSTTLQEKLGIEQCAEMEIHSNCSGVGKAMQVAFDALALGRYKTALVTYVQLSSVYLRASYFNQAKMNKTQAALRYILADGAGAVLLEAVEAAPDERVPREVLGCFVESVGGKLPPAMTAGAGVADLVKNANPSGVVDAGLHHLDQDFSAVNRFAGPRLFDGAVRMVERLGLNGDDIQHYIGSIPTMQLYEDNIERFSKHFGATTEQMKFRARNTGYVGGASILLHFDEMVRNQELTDGQVCLLHSVESSKWMSAGFVVRW